MEVQINQFVKKENENKGKFSQLLRVKKDLVQKKKEGTYFFTKDIAPLSSEDTVDFYYIGHPGRTVHQNAFPMPKTVYTKYKNKKGLPEMMRKY